MKITIDTDIIESALSIPESALGMVLFAHGAGSTRYSKRNNFVADQLQQAELATSLIDLLTPEEKKFDQETREIRFDIDHLEKRVTGTVDSLAENDETKSFQIGIFGSSTGAAGGLIASAIRPDMVQTAVSLGGRVDMAEGYLRKIKMPVLSLLGIGIFKSWH